MGSGGAQGWALAKRLCRGGPFSLSPTPSAVRGPRPGSVPQPQLFVSDPGLTLAFSRLPALPESLVCTSHLRLPGPALPLQSLVPGTF